MSIENLDLKEEPVALTSIPLINPSRVKKNASVADLIKDAYTHTSTLFRAEIALAKSEVVDEVKKGLTGSVFFIIAGVIALYSSFFFFFFLAELLKKWLPGWASFGIVFLIMLFTAALFGLIGFLRVRKIRKPHKVIDSVKSVPEVLPNTK